MLLVGLVCGFIVGMVVFSYIMRKFMIIGHKLDGSFENAQKAIQEAIPQVKGWSFPIAAWDFYKAQLAKNYTYKNIKNIVIYFICNSAIANRVLSTDPNMGSIMPCSWALYETVSGEVFLAEMNIPLMSKMYFGVIGKALGEVASNEKVMMNNIKEKLLNK